MPLKCVSGTFFYRKTAASGCERCQNVDALKCWMWEMRKTEDTSELFDLFDSGRVRQATYTSVHIICGGAVAGGGWGREQNGKREHQRTHHLASSHRIVSIRDRMANIPTSRTSTPSRTTAAHVAHKSNINLHLLLFPCAAVAVQGRKVARIRNAYESIM